MKDKIQSWLEFPGKLNLTPLKIEFWAWLAFGIVSWLVGKWFDQHVFEILPSIQTPELNEIVIFLTERVFWAILVGFAVITLGRVWYNDNHRSKLLPGFFAMAVTAIVTVILKQFFDIPRPFLAIEGLRNLVYSVEFQSFPSFHTAVSFALLIPLYRISRLLGSGWAILAILIGVARVYEHVHYPSDISGGIFLGGLIGAVFSHPVTEAILQRWWKNLEFRRQTMHFSAGFLIVFAHWMGFLRWRWIAVIIGIGLVISLISINHQIPYISKLLALFDRERDHRFPGRGAVYFLLGTLLTIAFFERNVAYAAILILSIGDSVNHLFWGKETGITPLPWNPRKNFQGLAVGILTGFIAAQFFVPIWPAAIASIIAIGLETVRVRIGKIFIDDNIFVPLVAGLIIWLMI